MAVNIQGEVFGVVMPCSTEVSYWNITQYHNLEDLDLKEHIACGISYNEIIQCQACIYQWCNGSQNVLPHSLNIQPCTDP